MTTEVAPMSSTRSAGTTLLCWRGFPTTVLPTGSHGLTCTPTCPRARGGVWKLALILTSSQRRYAVSIMDCLSMAPLSYLEKTGGKGVMIVCRVAAECCCVMHCAGCDRHPSTSACRPRTFCSACRSEQQRWRRATSQRPSSTLSTCGTWRTTRRARGVHECSVGVA